MPRSKRLPALKSFTFHGWTASAPTLAEAKQQAIAACERAAEGYYSPEIISHMGVTGVLFRRPEGYSYFLVHADQAQSRRLTPCRLDMNEPNESLDQNKERVWRALCRHIAQITMPIGQEPIPPAFLTDKQDRQEYVRYARWQNAYAAHKQAHPKASDEEHRAHASGWAD